MDTQNSRARDQIRQAYGLGSQPTAIGPHGIEVAGDEAGRKKTPAAAPANGQIRDSGEGR